MQKTSSLEFHFINSFLLLDLDLNYIFFLHKIARNSYFLSNDKKLFIAI